MALRTRSLELIRKLSSFTGDVNEDGVVNIADAIGIMRIAMGLN